MSIRLRRLSLAVTTILLILLIVNLVRSTFDLIGLRERLVKAESEVTKLKGEKQTLEDKLNDPSGNLAIESLIRDKLGLAKPDETAVIIPEELLRDEALNLPKDQPPQDLPTWRKWWSLFF
ncbi:hypothetical protein A3A66_03455 [Microgenomates group bacterium RIFCSPLOWO2_01_FULL_46_13]|nr:MAG: hypothetical protein A2783_04635 [Microgenomates group bacterium RIFCSPHIGHO2_01_FULL_45_11]OGV95045.1 MAG: hypothetical protein A3A66_03455 [Microgenomates group bacterium RIFCSPLOWO2_01_FULL_46_13]